MKKKLLRSIFIILLMLPLIAVAHYFAFPEETNCILIRFADFEKNENLFFRKNTPAEKIITLQKIRVVAENRLQHFWGKQTILNYDIVYCNNEKDFNRYGHAGAPAATQLKCGAWVVVKEESLDEDIVAHEISHTILYNNIGWYKTRFEIPLWFSEGLAMQVDDRNYYSIDTLLAKKNSGLVLPDVTQLRNASGFYAGTRETIMLNYATSKYIVHEWLKTHSLSRFIEDINKGLGFEKSYRQE